MAYQELAPIDMNIHTEARNASRDRNRRKMMMHIAAFIVVMAAGFTVGGASVAATVAVWWAVVLIVRRRFWNIRSQAVTGPELRPQPMTYEKFEDVNDLLEDIAQRRNWELEKRFDIARLACENQTTTFDELERRYDQGIRSAYSMRRKDASKEWNTDEGG
jgi:hypothetical protein